MGGFLIPANSKKSLLYFGAFTISDLILLVSGICVTLVLLLLTDISSITNAIIGLLPAGICGFLVFPIPNYHNMMTIIKSIYAFYTTNQKLVWKGWCVTYGDKKE